MDLIQNKIKETMDVIDEMTTYFYQQQDELGYVKLDIALNHIEGILVKLIEMKQQNVIELEEAVILNNLNNAMVALGKKDTILLSDILKYEVYQQLQTVLEQL